MSNTIRYFHDYWLAGSGSASTPWLDEHVEKSSDDLPFFAGRALKGVLRDAVRCAQEWGWLPAYPQGMSPQQQAVWPGWTVALFGSSQTEQGGLSPNQSRSASLLIGNANLPEEVQAFLRQRPEHKEQLQRALFATSIDDETGVALAGSLRGMEVSVPMLLLAPIEALPHAPLGWQEVVQQVLLMVMMFLVQLLRHPHLESQTHPHRQPQPPPPPVLVLVWYLL